MEDIRPPAGGTRRPAPPRNKENSVPSGVSRAGAPRISSAMGGFLIAVALLFDGAQAAIEAIFGLTIILAPIGIVASSAISVAAWLTFFLWLHNLGLGMIQKGGGGGITRSPFAVIAGAVGIKFVPLINMLPAWTAAMATIVIRERARALIPSGAARVKK